MMLQNLTYIILKLSSSWEICVSHWVVFNLVLYLHSSRSNGSRSHNHKPCYQSNPSLIDIGVLSVSNESRLPGIGRGWNWTEGPGPAQALPSNLNLVTSTRVLPGPDPNPSFFGQVQTRPWLHSTCPATLVPILYLSPDRIVTWSKCQLSCFSSYSTSHFQLCDQNYIHWIAAKYSDSICDTWGV